MQKPFYIRKIAVLGAGVMGAQIAAHCVNAGIETYLFDLAEKEGDKTGIVNRAIRKLSQLKPSPLATTKTSALLKARNYDEHLAELNHCDLIIEAIAERLDWKEALYQRITPYLNEHSILVSNTSGLSINALKEVLPKSLQHRFCGVHFFNPPRYMHLAELIPADTTEPLLLDHLESWLTSYLGKGVIRAKDTPNFIANRIGVFSLLTSLYWAEVMKLGLDEVDALTGTLLGRPKSATCRTMDVVGLDTMAHVVKTMQQQLKEDPWHSFFTLPSWLTELIEQGYLGQKTAQGIYRKQGKVIEIYDIEHKKYRPAEGLISAEVKDIMAIKDAKMRMERLAQSSHPQAQFLSACLTDLFHYCAFHLQEIAETVRDVDLAMRWGFGWQKGPFETWQELGITHMSAYIDAAITTQKSMSDVKLPQWIRSIDTFYCNRGAYSPAYSGFVEPSQLPVYQRQFFKEDSVPFSKKVLFENDGVVLWHLADHIGVVEFKSKANSIGQLVLDGLNQALDVAERQCSGLIVYQNDAMNFSAGANLREVASFIEANRFDAVEEMISEFQALAMRMKYSMVPTVAALRGRALGGGCELMMHCQRTMAAFESYPGLVELGVGLIPAGGGCKEMAMRASAKSSHDLNLMMFIAPYYEQIAKAQVAESAIDAQVLGYLKESDEWVMHQNEVLFAAMMQVKAMLAANHQPPISQKFRVAGIEGRAQLEVGLVNWLEGGYISQYDYFLASQLAYVLCGGNVNQGELVDEAWMLKLEKEAFMSLVANPSTHARIKYLLETGKPLRN